MPKRVLLRPARVLSKMKGTDVVPQTVPVLFGGDGLRCHEPSPPSQACELRPEGPDATEGNDAGGLDGALAVHVDPEHVAAHVVRVGQREVR